LNDEESTSKFDFDVEAGRRKLEKLETEFSEAAARKGLIKAYDAYLAEDVRMLRPNVAPAIGQTAAAELVSAIAGKLTWKWTATDVSRTGDLGYVYGTFELQNQRTLVERGSYVRVWKKENGAWRIVIDVASPDPPN
jgi:ketosteroid isomerase-like protein